METINLKVNGLSCPGCAVDMENILKGTDGILKAEVNYSKETMKIEYDPKEIREREILSVIKGMGVKPEPCK